VRTFRLNSGFRGPFDAGEAGRGKFFLPFGSFHVFAVNFAIDVCYPQQVTLDRLRADDAAQLAGAVVRAGELRKTQQIFEKVCTPKQAVALVWLSLVFGVWRTRIRDQRWTTCTVVLISMIVHSYRKTKGVVEFDYNMCEKDIWLTANRSSSAPAVFSGPQRSFSKLRSATITYDQREHDIGI
jgi:hypothetical protein